jgi:hypothetical protein
VEQYHQEINALKQRRDFASRICVLQAFIVELLKRDLILLQTSWLTKTKSDESAIIKRDIQLAREEIASLRRDAIPFMYVTDRMPNH